MVVSEGLWWLVGVCGCPLFYRDTSEYQKSCHVRICVEKAPVFCQGAYNLFKFITLVYYTLLYFILLFPLTYSVIYIITVICWFRPSSFYFYFFWTVLFRIPEFWVAHPGSTSCEGYVDRNPFVCPCQHSFPQYHMTCGVCTVYFGRGRPLAFRVTANDSQFSLSDLCLSVFEVKDWIKAVIYIFVQCIIFLSSHFGLIQWN